MDQLGLESLLTAMSKDFLIENKRLLSFKIKFELGILTDVFPNKMGNAC